MRHKVYGQGKRVLAATIDLKQRVHNVWEASMARAVAGDQWKGWKIRWDEPPDLEIGRPLRA